MTPQHKKQMDCWVTEKGCYTKNNHKKTLNIPSASMESEHLQHPKTKPPYLETWKEETTKKTEQRCYHSRIMIQREREKFYLTMHSTHFIYGYMVSDIW